MFTIFSWSGYVFGFGLLLLLSVFQVVAAKKWYKHVYNAAINSTLLYSLIWSSIFVSFIINVLLIGARGLYLIKLNKPMVYIIFMGHTMIMFVTQIAAALAVNVKRKDFPVPLVLHYSFLGCICPHWSSVLIQSLVIWNVFVFIQQIAFHSFYLIIALHTQPIGAASMLMIYTVFVFSLVSLVGLLMQLAQFIKHIICKQEVKKLSKNIKRLASAVMAGIIVMCLMIIWTAFMLISSEFLLDTTRLTHPVIASLLISGSCWIGNNMISTHWTQRVSQGPQQHSNNDDETELATVNASMMAPLIKYENETQN